MQITYSAETLTAWLNKVLHAESKRGEGVGGQGERSKRELEK